MESAHPHFVELTVNCGVDCVTRSSRPASSKSDPTFCFFVIIIQMSSNVLSYAVLAASQNVWHNVDHYDGPEKT